MATPIRHKDCGGIAMWYVGPTDPPIQAIRSRDIRYLDGRQPEFMEAIPRCPVCGGELRINWCAPEAPPNLRRCFDEDLDPGFEITKVDAQ